MFVVHGDLTKLGLDDIVVPCDARLNVTRGFETLLGTTEKGDRHGWIRPVGVQVPEHFDGNDRHPILLGEQADEPRVWLFNSAISKDDREEENLAWLRAGLQSLFQAVTEHPADPLFGRSRRTIGIPMVGVGEGGFEQMRAEVIDGLLDEIQASSAGTQHPDIVVVAWERSDYAALQMRRPEPEVPRGVNPKQLKQLGLLASRGELVAFLGAGVSKSAGLPDWKELLSQLAMAAQLQDLERDDVLKLAPEDAAEALRNKLGHKLGEQLRSRFQSERCGLSHSLVASMRLHEVVTTNYDNLFEMASERPHDGGLAVLPRERLDAGRPWLLKLHGDLEKPDTIVLTRSQYFEFDTDSAPLASVVQSQMVTKHLMFVGYSGSDLNFIRLAHQVRALFRRYQPDETSASIGTVVALGAHPAESLLWKGVLDYLEVDATGDEGGRQVEILLDCLAHEACDESPYLLDARYKLLLNDSDGKLAEALADIASSGAVGADTAAWKGMKALLREFGADIPQPPNS